jgi:hypothetical protein
MFSPPITTLTLTPSTIRLPSVIFTKAIFGILQFMKVNQTELIKLRSVQILEA